MNFKLSNEIYEELTSNKYPTLFEIEIGEEEKIRVVRYEDYKRLENIIKEISEFAKLRKEMYERQENVVGQEVIISLLKIVDKGE